MAVKIRRQLSIFLKNEAGVLARVCKSLAEAKVNLTAISVSDTVDHAVVRLLVSNPDKAREILEEHGLLVVDTEVLEVALPNKPGALGEIAQKLAKGRVNIEYAYGTAGSTKRASCLILRVNKAAKAVALLGG